MGDKDISTVMNFLKEFKQTMQDKIYKAEKTNGKIEEHLGKMDVKIENLDNAMKEMTEKNKVDKDDLDKRLKKLEEDMKHVKFAKLKSPDRSNKTDLTILPVQKTQQTGIQGKQLPGRIPSADQPREHVCSEPQLESSSWHNEMQRKLESAAGKGECRGVKRKEAWIGDVSPVRRKESEEDKVDKTKAVNWFGYEDAETDESTDEDETRNGDDSWNKVDRMEMKRRKKQEKKERQRKTKLETNRRAASMIGNGPVTESDVSRRMTRGVNYEEAKVRTVKDFLGEQLEYDQWELNNLVKLAQKWHLRGTYYMLHWKTKMK